MAHPAARLVRAMTWRAALALPWAITGSATPRKRGACRVLLTQPRAKVILSLATNAHKNVGACRLQIPTLAFPLSPRELEMLQHMGRAARIPGQGARFFCAGDRGS